MIHDTVAAASQEINKQEKFKLFIVSFSNCSLFWPNQQVVCLICLIWKCLHTKEGACCSQNNVTRFEKTVMSQDKHLYNESNCFCWVIEKGKNETLTLNLLHNKKKQYCAFNREELTLQCLHERRRPPGSEHLLPPEQCSLLKLFLYSCTEFENKRENRQKCKDCIKKNKNKTQRHSCSQFMDISVFFTLKTAYNLKGQTTHLLT